jgi:hypothetical protein
MTSHHAVTAIMAAPSRSAAWEAGGARTAQVRHDPDIAPGVDSDKYFKH